MISNKLGRARELKPAWQFAGENLPLAIISSQIEANRAFADFHESSQEIGRNLRNIWPDFAPESLHYPAAGFDAATPFLIFPSLRRVIAIDDHHFHFPENTAENIVVPIVAPAQNAGFTVATQVDHQGAVARAILGRLAMGIPNLRVLSVTSYAVNGFGSHGRIVFDQGPNTLIREYIHLHIIELQGNLIGNDGSEYTQWLEEVIMRSPREVLLAKGAMLFFTSTLGHSLMRSFEATPGALFLDGDGLARLLYQHRADDPARYDFPPIEPPPGMAFEFRATAVENFGYTQNQWFVRYVAAPGSQR